MTGPLYKEISFCRKPETLWGKLESGRWDWLGVHPNGQYVLGSPPVSRIRVAAGATVIRADTGELRRHGIRVDAPLAPKSEDWYPTAEAARAAYGEKLAELRKQGAEPVILRVRLFEDGNVVEDEYIVHRPATYG